MGNYEQLKKAVVQYIYENGQQKITGKIMQSVLLGIINSIGGNATFAGVATPETTPGTPDGNVFYIAGPGTYPNFGGARISGIGVFYNEANEWKFANILDVLQDVGDSTTATMSQYAITTLVNNSTNIDIVNYSDLDRYNNVNQCGVYNVRQKKGSRYVSVGTMMLSSNRLERVVSQVFFTNLVITGGTINGDSVDAEVHTLYRVYNINSTGHFVPKGEWTPWSYYYLLEGAGDSITATMSQRAITTVISNVAQALDDRKVDKTTYAHDLEEVHNSLDTKEEKENTEAHMTMPFDGIVNVTQPIILNKFPIAPYKIVYDANYGTYGAFLAEKDGSYFLDFYEEKYYNNDVHQPLDRKVFINNAQSYVYIESKGLVLNGGEIKQDLGDSSNDTMSQKAITDTISRVTQILESEKEDKATTEGFLPVPFSRIQEVYDYTSSHTAIPPYDIIYASNEKRFMAYKDNTYYSRFDLEKYYNQDVAISDKVRKGKLFVLGSDIYRYSEEAGTLIHEPLGGYMRPLYEAAGAVYNVGQKVYDYNGGKYTEKEMAELFASGSTMAEASKYGIYIDYAHEGKVTRTGNMALHRVVGGLPIQNGIVAGYLTDDGKFTPIDWSKPEEIVKDGSKGQMMARIPQHYYTFTEDVNGLKIDLNQYPSKGAIEMPLHYVSMYEASIARDTNTLASVVNLTANYRGGGNQADRDGQDNTLLGRPVTAKSLTSFREAAKRRGKGWIDYDEFVHADLAMLFYIEYATLNVQLPYNAELTPEGFRQGGLGSGVTNLSYSAWNAFSGTYPFIPCGHSDVLGNNSGEVEYKMPKAYNDAAGDGKEHSTFVPRFHCIENLFGHIYKWVDGVLIDIQADNAGGKSKLYVCRDIDKMGSTITEDYEYVGDIARVDGYVKIIMGGKYGLLMPRETGGSSVSYFCDYSYTSVLNEGSSLRALCVGGDANSGADTGFACANSTNSPATTAAYFGSRPCFFPRNYENNIII